MPVRNYPDTPAIASAIVSFAQALTYPDTTPVYKSVHRGKIKDIVDLVANGAACLEVYGNLDGSERHAFGGRIHDPQTWYLLSIVSMDDSDAAETLIFRVRDALVQPFQIHATLNNAGSVFHAQIEDKSARFLNVYRNGQEFRAHLMGIMTRQEWVVPIPPGIVS